MKRIIMAALLLAAVLLLSGCESMDQALGKIGDDIKASRVDTPETTGGDFDWSFVPVVREMATKTFTEGFPQATIKESSVASKNGGSDRVIVTLTYEMDGKTGTYGFDYEKNEQGEYVLTRYGDGVDSDDL